MAIESYEEGKMKEIAFSQGIRLDVKDVEYFKNMHKKWCSRVGCALHRDTSIPFTLCENCQNFVEASKLTTTIIVACPECGVFWKNDRRQISEKDKNYLLEICPICVERKKKKN